MQCSTPDCKNPRHPSGAPPATLLVDETATHYVFACPGCRDILQILSVQVRVKTEYQRRVRNDPRMVEYKRARMVERDPTNGRVTYFR